jgi:hypothetical protein
MIRENHGNVYEIIADQGATFSRQLSLKSSAKRPVTINNTIGRMKITDRKDKSIVFLYLTTENSMISINGSLGTINLEISASDMSDIPAGKYTYDLEIEEVSTGIITRIVHGNFTVRPEVTR